MSRAGRFLRNVSSNYAVTAVDALVFILLTPFIVHHLGIELYAVWVIMQTIAYYLDFLDVGLPDAQVRQHAILVARNDPDGVAKLQGTVFVLYLAAGAAAMLAAAGLVAMPTREWLDIPASADAAFAPVLLLFGLAASLAFLEGGLDNVFEGYQRFDVMNAVHVVFQVLSALATVIVLDLGFGLVALALIKCVDTALGAIVKLLLVRRLFPPEARPGLGFDRESWQSIKSYSLWNSLNDFMTEGTAQFDKIFIPVLLSSVLVTPYSLVVALAAAIFLLAEPITDTFLPIAAERHDKNDRHGLTAFLTRGTKLVTLATLPVTIVVAVFGTSILDLWVGGEYTDVPVPVLWFTAANFFFSTYLWTALSLLMAAGELKRIFWMSVFEVALVLLLILALVPRLGLPGLALAGLIANVLTGAGLFIPAACRCTLLAPGPFIGRTLVPLCLAALPGLGFAVWLEVRFAPSTWVGTLSAGAMTVAVALTSLLMFGTTRRERRRYFVTVRRLAGRR